MLENALGKDVELRNYKRFKLIQEGCEDVEDKRVGCRSTSRTDENISKIKDCNQ